MNFYKHHLGDYAAATAHLSWDEDCAYRRLIDQYYKREAPIPAETREACRLARASTPGQRKAVEVVLREFFTLQDDGWHQKRCDVEISEANEFGEDRDAKIENEKERQRRHRAERKKLFEQLRRHDIVPPWDTKIETLREMVSNVPVTQPVTQPVTPVTRTATAIQTPDSISQTPDSREELLPQTSSGSETTVARLPSSSAGENPPKVDRKISLDAVRTVFDHWRTLHGHPQAKLDDKRRKLVAKALTAYSEADLCLAIAGYRNSPHHMGANKNDTVYDDIELMLRDAKHIDAGIRFSREPPRNLSSLTRKNVDATADWVPPEMRDATN